MALEFFLFGGSPFAWRVHLVLEYKGLSYNAKFLSLGRGEHKSPEFLKLNPRGRVPVLRDGDIVLCESVAIIAYLDEICPTPPLFGASSAETAHIWQRVQEIENYARNPFLRMAIDIFNGEIEHKQSEAGELLILCIEQLDWIEGILSKSYWIAGETLTAADFVFYPVLMIFMRAIARDEVEISDFKPDSFSKKWPACKGWMAQVEQISGYENTYPPHWRN